jgi:pilus assembly protein CpaC
MLGAGRTSLHVLVVFALVASVGLVPAQAQVRPGQERETSARLLRFDITIGKSQVIDLKEPFTRVSVTNPAIADVFVITPNQILINGKAPGVTSLVVFYPDRTMYFDLVVQTDVNLLKERLKRVVPRDDIDVQAAGDSIILIGKVSSEQYIEQAGKVAEVFGPKRVVNLLSATDLKTQQVLLQVHVAEASRTALKELGFSARALGRAFQGAAFPGSTFLPGLIPSGSVSGSLAGLPIPPVSDDAFRIASPDFGFSDLVTFFLSSGAERNYAGVVRALAQKGLVRVLAKPNLITVSGKEAKFLSGGEFPYPVPSASTGGGVVVTIQFKPFGVQLIFTPIVREDQHITLKVAAEDSSLDFATPLQIQGFNIPTIRSNRAGATLELKDGESFAMAGLINTRVRQQLAKIPVLGDIPILGALFRSTKFLNEESELLFLVTVRLVKPFAPGEAPDSRKLMELRESERNETGFTLVPGIPGVGDVVEKPFGESSFPANPPPK